MIDLIVVFQCSSEARLGLEGLGQGGLGQRQGYTHTKGDCPRTAANTQEVIQAQTSE